MKPIFRTGVVLVVLFAAAVLTGAAFGGTTGIPDINNSYAECAFTGPSYATVLVQPDGGGNLFDQARTADGTIVDAVITMTLLDGLNTPIENFPFEDIWLDALDGGLAPCPGGNVADANTDMQGRTTFRYPMQAGGYSEGPSQVFVMGIELESDPLPVNFNSSDLNGDGTVDLQDLGIFAGDMGGVFAMRSDLYRNGILDLSDLGVFASGYGHSCP